MSYTHPKYGLVTPDNQTKAKDLGAELKQMGTTIEAALAGFDYDGADPNLVLARVAALEATTQHHRPAASGRINIPVSASNQEFTRTITFPEGRFANAPYVTISPEANYGVGANWYWRVSTRTATSVTIGVYRFGGTAASIDLQWIAVG